MCCTTPPPTGIVDRQRGGSYTLTMTCALLLIILAQIAEPVELGEDRVSVFTLSDGSRLYGVIAADMDRVVRIYLDEPWKSE